jgi:small subunit ribosomal protein S6
MLDPGPDEAGRDALAQEVRGRIEGKGTLKHENKWGLRKMAYEIGGRNEADYRWLRFEAPTELLDELNHNLKIADGVLRFRIFKVDPDAPVMIPPAVAAPAPGASRDRGDRDRGPQGAPRAAVAAEPADADEPVTEPAAESAPESADVPAAPAE